MTHEEQIAKLTEMLEIQQKLHETAIDMLKPAIEIAIQKEREACAKVCETGLPIATSLSALDDMEMWGEKFAVAIRARGQA